MYQGRLSPFPPQEGEFYLLIASYGNSMPWKVMCLQKGYVKILIFSWSSRKEEALEEGFQLFLLDMAVLPQNARDVDTSSDHESRKQDC